MRTFLAIIGALAIFVVGVFAVLVFIGLNAVKPLTDEATAYADDAIPAIATGWDADEVLERASPELLAELTGDSLNGVMAFGMKNLGAMTDYGGAACEIVNFQVTAAEGELVQASCEARATHELGSGSYSLALLKRNDAWSLLGFFVAPDRIIETDDNARTVNFVGAPLNAITISLAGRSIGLTTGRTFNAGADIQGFEKIENLPQAE